MKDLISIIIPMFNAEKYISNLLLCLKEQTYKNLEIIVVDDGSTDNCLEIVKKCKNEDNRIVVIPIPHGGIGKARNTGIEYANGEYITFLDADDYISIDMYERLILKIKETKCDLIRCNFDKKDEKGNIIESSNSLLDISNKLLNNEDIRMKLIPYVLDDKIPTYTPLIIAKSYLIKDKLKLKFNTDINMMEDLIFCLNLYINSEQIYLYDLKCYYYVVHSSSSTKSRANLMRNYNDTIKVVHLLEKFLDKYEMENNIFSIMYYTYSTILIKYLLRTFRKDDEYTLSYEEMKKALTDNSASEIIEKADFTNCKNKFIKLAGNYIQEREYRKLYEYAIEIREEHV